MNIFDFFQRVIDRRPATRSASSASSDRAMPAPYSSLALHNDQLPVAVSALAANSVILQESAAVTIRSAAALSLEQAIELLDTDRHIRANSLHAQRQQLAFQRLRDHLERHDFARHSATFQPLLSLVARRIGALTEPLQREQAMSMLERGLQAWPQLLVVEALTPQLTDISFPLQQRALTLIENFLQTTADFPESHIDILLALTDVMQLPACRERAYALIETGMRQLRDHPEVCALIRRGLMLTYCRDSQGLALQA
jgi:hypothetical protein